jgi:Trypsin-like peptidase domain
MSMRLDQLLNSCTVRIEVPEERSEGTGFFFAPKLILTCAHVVKKSTGEFVKVFPNGYNKPIQAKIVFCFPEEVDLAILQVNLQDRFQCVLLGAEIQPGDQCYTYGYTDPKQGFPEGDPVTLECEGITGGLVPKIKLKGGKIRPGLSGSPLLNLNTGKVCGVVKFTFDRQSHQGGGAVPTNLIFLKFSVLEDVHNKYHKSNSKWLDLLNLDTDAYDSDWTYLDEEAQRRENYIKTLFFLLKVAFKWFLLGRKAPRAFPMKTIAFLVEHTFKRDLGQEIKRQRKDLTRKLTFEVDPNGCNQAKLLNKLDSQAEVLSQLINMLVSEEQDIASVSRLLWATEVIYEQRDLIGELKQKEGNYYPQLELLKKRKSFQIFDNRDSGNYMSADRIISRLMARHTNTNLVLWNSLSSWINELIENIGGNPKFGVLLIEKILSSLMVDFVNPSSSKPSVSLIIDDLEEEIRKNPRLKILKKVQILLESVAGKLVQGGPYRAWSATGAYHFNRQCKLYPERVQLEEMDRILCYDTREEAERNHLSCKICQSAENSSNKAAFLGDETGE